MGRGEPRSPLFEVPAYADRTVFVGEGGRMLADSEANPAVYDLVEDVGYVRAKVIDSMGHVAWTQPVFVEPPRP